jgi:short subunit fatty acids transporter
MASNGASEKAGVYSETASRAIEVILLALTIIASSLTTIISPYFTITVAVILAALLIVYLMMKDKRSTERYKAKLQQDLEKERNKQWNESTKITLDQSSKAGAIRNAKFAMCQAIIEAFQESVNDPHLPELEKKVYDKVITRIRDMEKAVMQIW